METGVGGYLFIYYHIIKICNGQGCKWNWG